MIWGCTQAVTKGPSVTQWHHFSAAGLSSLPTRAGLLGSAKLQNLRKRNTVVLLFLQQGRRKKISTFLNGLGLGRNLSHGRMSGNEKIGSQTGTVFKKAQQERSINKLQV